MINKKLKEQIMLDFRIITFLSVCRHMNFTYAAEELHITQPAVSQHIRFLEEHYGEKLFERDGKKIKLTPAGKILKATMTVINDDEASIISRIQNSAKERKSLKIGVTLTIGEYVIANPLSKYIKNHLETDIRIYFANTAELSKMLTEGKLDIAVVEGNFNSDLFESYIYKSEEYIPVCSSAHKFAKKVKLLTDLLPERLIVRESGSGTRDILEKNLEARNVSVSDFFNITEAENIHLIVNLVKQDCGITFLYKAAVEEEIKNGNLREISLDDFSIQHNFTFIWNRGSVFAPEYRQISNEFINA